MKVDIYRCDGCQCEDKADGSAQQMPRGWYQVTTRKADAKQDTHLCSATCLMEYATKEFAESEKDIRR